MIKISIGGFMSVRNKKLLSVIVYYTLAILALCSAAFFIYCLTTREIALWAKVVYFIWVAVAIGVVIFDIICTSSGEGKFFSGLIIYVLSILSVVMACILYFMNTGVEGMAVEFLGLFLSVSIVALMTSGYMIATWCVGESLIEHRTAQDEIHKR